MVKELRRLNSKELKGLDKELRETSVSVSLPRKSTPYTEEMESHKSVCQSDLFSSALFATHLEQAK